MRLRRPASRQPIDVSGGACDASRVMPMSATNERRAAKNIVDMALRSSSELAALSIAGDQRVGADVIC